MKAAILAGLVLLAAPLPALAQAYQCRAPERIELPKPILPDGPARNTRITGYSLAISWSPEFCRGGKAAKDSSNYQCNGAIGRFGFVLHGLWPESGVLYAVSADGRVRQRLVLAEGDVRKPAWSPYRKR